MSLPATLEANPETGFPNPPEGKVWTQWPPDPLFLSEPEWYNTLGQDPIDRDQIFSLPHPEGITRIKALLVEHPTKGLTILFKAAVKGKVEVVRALLEYGVNPVARDGEDETLVPLHAACYNGHLECAKSLHEVGGVDVNLRDDLGGTPLMRSAWGARAEIVQWLLLNGADPAIRQYSDVDALEFGAGGGNAEVVKAIFENERSQGKPVITAKALAAGAGSGSEAVVRYLLQKGGYPDDPKDSITHGAQVEASWKGDRLQPSQKQAIDNAIPRAAVSGSLPVVKLLLSYLTLLSEGRLLDSDSRGVISTSVLQAASGGHANIVEFLLDTSFPLTSPDPGTSVLDDRADLINTSLVAAAESGDLSTVKLLLDKYGADVNFAQRPQNVTALYRAAGNGKTEIIQCLLKDHNADIHGGSGRYANGPTALWVAILNQQIDTVNALLEFGGPVESIDIDINEGTKQVWLAARKEYRAPVTVQSHRLESEDTKWMHLKYAERVPWLADVQLRKPDEALQVEGREMKVPGNERDS